MAEIDSLERPEDVEKDAPGIVRRWVLELKLADKREKDWRAKAQRAIEKYKQKDTKRHSFNILWSNTETLRQAVYNSPPKADVRRRFKDADPVGKQVSTILARALEYGIDTTDFHHDVQSTVLDMLLAGRGVVRVRYVPSLQQVGVGEETHEEELEQHQDGEEALEGDSEEVEWEQAPIEHVQWDDFRLGEGKEWGEVPWIGFRHRLTRDKLVEQFGEIGKQVKVDSTDNEEIEQERDELLAQSFQTAEVWELWDKEEQRVVFICKSYKEAPLKVVPDPLGLQGFFPVPRPCYAVEDSQSLVPTPPYEMYKEQAEELNRISVRINKLIEGLKNRGVYDATLTELDQLTNGDDNELIPAQNVTALLERGGLDKAIWMMPMEQAAKVLQALYIQRDQTKQVIYELTGISDIMRSASDPAETYGAQKIKTQWGTQRLQRMQQEIQRFVRDCIRLQSEIIAERFAPETLATMTGVKLPHQAEVDAQKQQSLLQWQQQVIQAQQTGQQPPPPPQMPPDPITWEAVLEVMRDDKQRTFRVDVETDSTIAATLDEDMSGLTEVLTAVVKVVEGFAPAVMQGAMPVDAVKEIVMTVCRRAKLGNAVEDALDKMQAPQPPADPNAGQAQFEQAKLQATAHLEQMKAQLADQQHQREIQSNMELERWKQEQQALQNQHQAGLDAEKEMRIAQLEAEAEARNQAFDERIKQMEIEAQNYKAELDYRKAIEVAEISANATLTAAQANAATQAAKGEEVETPDDKSAQMLELHGQTLDALRGLIEQLARPKTVVHGPDGRAVGIQ